MTIKEQIAKANKELRQLKRDRDDYEGDMEQAEQALYRCEDDIKELKAKIKKLKLKQ